MELVIKIPEELYETLKNPEILSTMYHASRAADAVRSGTPLPKGHETHPYFNGVTNGDVIKAVFPNADCFEREIVNGLKYMTVWFADARISHVFDIDWWNAPYKGGEEDEN